MSRGCTVIWRWVHVGIVVLVCALVGLVAPRGVDAHRPWFNLSGSPDPNAPYAITDLAVSQVIYGALGAVGRVDFYGFTADPGFTLDLQIVVPAVARCADFRPTLIVWGPGLGDLGPLPPDVATPTSIASPAADDPREGLIAAAPAAEWGTFFEPFTRTTYATGPRVERTLTGGDYLAAVMMRDPDDAVGTYGLALGGAERLGGDPAFLTKIAAIERCEPPVLPAATPTRG